VQRSLGIVPGIERDDAHVVARDQPPPPRLVVQHEREHAAQLVEEPLAVLGVQRQDHLAVRTRLELVVALQLRLQLLVVVDLAVHRQHMRALGVLQRLRPTHRIDDRQPLMRQDRVGRRVDARPVGPAVPHQA
jgi:hypothetical protein